MPLNLSNRDQSSGYLFYNRRLRAAITRFSVRMKHDDRKQQAAVVLSMVFVLIGVAWMTLLHFMKPAGLIGQDALVGNRETGQVYARIDGRLYPALNLTSARLVTGSAADPVWVTGPEIARHPTGPLIGIPGVPDEFVTPPTRTSAWTVCDTAPRRGAHTRPRVTVIAGPLPDTDRSESIGGDRAVLVTHRDVTYLLWAGQRARIDPADRAVTLNLGLDPGVTQPIEISTALLDAIPVTEPLTMPVVAGAGEPSTWLAGTPVGSVLATRDAAGTVTGFYVLLPEGVQQISGFVADLLRTGRSGDPQPITPDALVHIPVVDVLDVDHYPAGRLSFVDTAAAPVTCLQWSKQTGDPQATVTLRSGPGLPVAPGDEARLVNLVRDDRSPDSVEADQTLLLRGAATLVVTTSAARTSDSRESLYALSAQGVRFGIQWDQQTLQALGIDPAAAVQAPWPLLRTFAAGPAISRDAALLARDTLGGAVVGVPTGPGS